MHIPGLSGTALADSPPVPGLFIVVVVAVVVAWAVITYQNAQRRIEALSGFAATHGFRYSAKAPKGFVRGFDFHLFSEGDGRGAENLLTGQWRGLPVAAADYWYYVETHDQKGGTSRTYHRFSVAVIDLAADVPHVRIEREDLFSWIADKIGMDDIELESEDFNRAFNLLARDREFACKLVDPRMMEWLLAAPSDLCVEVGGGHALVYRGRLDPGQLQSLLDDAADFVAQVPRLVWSEYGREVR